MSLKERIQNLFEGRCSAAVPSIKVLGHHREIVELEYRDASQTLCFSGELTGPGWKQINIRIPDAEWDQQLLDNIAAALRRRGYEFLIYRFGKEENISDDERSSALRELESMGYEIELSGDRRIVRQTLTAGVHPLSREEAQTMAPKMIRLLETVRGVRRPIEILRKSDAALN